MQHDVIPLWRQKMGESIGPWASRPGMVHEVSSTSWLLLSGAPSPDVNLALIYDDAPDVLGSILSTIDQAQCPAMVMLAGSGKARAQDLTGEWIGVGDMPMMSVELDRTRVAPDSRVRRAGAADVDVVTALVADAYDMPPDIAGVATDVLRTPSDTMTFWLLEHDGEAVSTVIACRVDDIVSLWCMSTPPRFARRGFGRALLGAVLGHAQAAGARTGLLGATPAGLPLYEATGWQHVENWQIFTNAQSAQFAD